MQAKISGEAVTVSLCMIVKDEGFFIEDCLSSARPYVDEIVVVDTGSTDNTREIARPLADTLADFTWIDDFASARNAAIELATAAWILVLDADERIHPDDFVRLRDALADTDKDGFYLLTRNYMDRKPKGWQPIAHSDPMARGFSGYTTHQIMKCFRRRRDIRYAGRVHEIVDASVAEPARGELPVVIHHYGDENEAKPRRDRALHYLRIMDEELAKAEDGRLFGLAGNTALNYSEDYAKAARYLRRAAELGYRKDESLEGAAEALYRGGEFGPALDLYLLVYDAGVRSSPLCLNMANLYVRSGDKAKGVQLLEECLTLGGIDAATDEIIRQNITLLTK